MTLTGTYNRNVDDKRRIAVPKPLRDQFPEKELSYFFVAPGTERSLVLYSPAGFDQLAAEIAQRSSGQQKVRNYLRLFYSQAARVDLDGQGRIRIPDRLADFAGLQREVTLLGVYDHVEIWDSQLWQQFMDSNSPEFDNIATQAWE